VHDPEALRAALSEVTAQHGTPDVVSSAALRNYALTLNAALAERGLYAGTLTIGGLVANGDIHHALAAEHGPGIPTLDPDDLADTAWHLHTDRDRPEVTFAALP
jgi:hypothetical protein